MQNIYVLGSTGFIGSQLMKYLKSKYKLSTYSVGRSNCDIYVDLEKSTNDLVNSTTKGDVVVFLSAISSPDFCSKYQKLAYKVNVTATVELINNLTDKGVKVIFSSTDMVFGYSSVRVVDNSPLDPFGDYGEMKAKVEHLVLNNNLVKIIRFSYVLGMGDKYSNLLSEMASTGKQLDVFDGFERNAVSIDDVLDGIYNLINRWNDIDEKSINFSGPELISRFKITQLYAESVHKHLRFKLVNAPVGFWDARPKTIEMDSCTFSKLLGKQPMSIKYKLQNWSEK
jgi:dTDP-4-dehydrorhamnose reductase